MVHRFLGSAAFALAFVSLGPMPVAGQAPKKWTARRTPDGQPDLQGIWSNATITPLERPNELAGKALFRLQVSQRPLRQAEIAAKAALHE